MLSIVHGKAWKRVSPESWSLIVTLSVISALALVGELHLEYKKILLLIPFKILDYDIVCVLWWVIRKITSVHVEDYW